MVTSSLCQYSTKNNAKHSPGKVSSRLWTNLCTQRNITSLCSRQGADTTQSNKTLTTAGQGQPPPSNGIHRQPGKYVTKLETICGGIHCWIASHILVDKSYVRVGSGQSVQSGLWQFLDALALRFAAGAHVGSGLWSTFTSLLKNKHYIFLPDSRWKFKNRCLEGNW